jgi:hypothetical protein
VPQQLLTKRPPEVRLQRAVEEHPTSSFIKGSFADLTLEIITSKSTASARA